MNRQGLLFTKLVLYLLMLIIPSMACVSGVNFGDQTTIETTITVSEDAMNRQLKYSFTDQDEDNLFDDITSIDLQSGLVRVYGNYKNSEGLTVPGSADIAFSTEAGMLVAEITAVDIAGLSIDHPRITHINSVLAEAFAEEADGSDEIEFVSVDITTNSMEIIVRVSVD